MIPFDIIRHLGGRAGYGKPGTTDYGRFRFTSFAEMTDEHLQASLDYHGVIEGGTHWQHLLEEKLYRAENEISISE